MNMSKRVSVVAHILFFGVLFFLVLFIATGGISEEPRPMSAVSPTPTIRPTPTMTAMQAVVSSRGNRAKNLYDDLERLLPITEEDRTDIYLRAERIDVYNKIHVTLDAYLRSPILGHRCEADAHQKILDALSQMLNTIAENEPARQMQRMTMASDHLAAGSAMLAECGK